MTAASFRDVERLSAYLDGELSQAERARLESRFARDAGLSAALDELRTTRALLRRTPRRRAPRSFTLTPKMAGLRPPQPRAVPVLRFASVVATLLLFVTFAGNLLGPIALGAQAPSPQKMAPAYGGGVGGGPAENATEATDKGLVIEATSTPEANALLAPAPMLEATPLPEARTLEQPTPTPEIAVLEQPAIPPSVPQTMPEEKVKPSFSLSPLQIALLALALILGCATFLLRWQTNRAFAKKVKSQK
jgi:hypothetical protein